jgi:biotin operon repressor
VTPIPNDGAGYGGKVDRSLAIGDRRLADKLLLGLLANGQGAENALTVKQIAERLEVSERKVRTLVTHLRRLGHPICATPDTGYFLPRSRAEAEHTLAFLGQRVQSTLEVKNGIERGLERTFDHDQLPLGTVA